MSSREEQLFKLGFVKNSRQEIFELYFCDVSWIVDFYKIGDYSDARWNILISDLILDTLEVKKQYYLYLGKSQGYNAAIKDLKQITQQLQEEDITSTVYLLKEVVKRMKNE